MILPISENRDEHTVAENYFNLLKDGDFGPVIYVRMCVARCCLFIFRIQSLVVENNLRNESDFNYNKLNICPNARVFKKPKQNFMVRRLWLQMRTFIF